MRNTKSKILRAAVTVSATCWLSTFGSTDAQAQSRVEGLELLDNVGRFTEPLRSYVAAKPTAAELEARTQIAEKLADQSGIKFEQQTVRPSDGRLVLTTAEDASAIFEIDGTTANLLFNGGLNKYRDEESTAGLPDKSTATDIALSQLRALELPVSEKEIGSIRVGGLNMAVPGSRGGSIIYEKLRTVRLERVLDGLRVEGDTRAVVQLGSRGALAGLVYQWPAIGKVRELSPDDLAEVDQIKDAALKQIGEVTGSAERSVLTEAELVLYDDSRGQIEPAYHFVVERYFAYGDDLPQNPYDFYIPAVLNPSAYYPHHQTAKVAPNDGRDQSKIRRTADE